ncbi:MAG: pyridoxamine 5'-phosphate oxidase family protein, partial [Anaerohalosphaeraceae bacterium]
MDLKEYFENSEGLGILSTADANGNVDSAIYASPHVTGEDTIALIMRPRLSLDNIQHNPKAVYMYIEKGPGYQGRRLYL